MIKMGFVRKKLIIIKWIFLKSEIIKLNFTNTFIRLSLLYLIFQIHFHVVCTQVHALTPRESKVLVRQILVRTFAHTIEDLCCTD